MAERFADAYGSLPWREILTSTRVRAIETALPLAARAGVSIRRDPRLDEIAYGAWQGLSKQEVAARDPERYAAWCQDPSVGPSAGETPALVAARASAAIDQLLRRIDDGTVLVVSHKTVLRLLLCRLLNVELRRYREVADWPVAAVTIVDFGADGRLDGPLIRRLADRAHLDGDSAVEAPAATEAAAG